MIARHGHLMTSVAAARGDHWTPLAVTGETEPGNQMTWSVLSGHCLRLRRQRPGDCHRKTQLSTHGVQQQTG